MTRSPFSAAEAVLLRAPTRRWPTAPEFWVFALGALAFAIDAWRPAPAANPADPIIALPNPASLHDSPQQMAAAELGQDAADDGETLQRWLRGEVLYREALRLGLDEADVIVRRRLIQKMEYVLDGMAAVPAPDESGLRAYYQEHAERYRHPPRYRFEHRFFSLADGHDAARRRAESALRGLSGNGIGAEAGDPYPDGRRLSGVAANRLLQLFGEEFLRGLDAAPQDTWSGPIRSRQGWHLVYREASEPAGLRPLDQVRAQVARDYLDAARRAQREQHYARIEERYVVLR